MENIIEDDKIKIIKLSLGPFGTNTYIVICQDTKESLVVDAPGEINVILNLLTDTVPKYIVITHNHFDHITALVELKDKLGVPVAINSLDAANLPFDPDIKLSDGDRLLLGNIELKIFNTPGHTAGSICLLINKFLISGDTIFPGGPGKTWTPGDFNQIVDSIKNKIFTLPDDTIILPGHGDSTIVHKEKAEFDIFSLKPHSQSLHGDVLWLSSE